MGDHRPGQWKQTNKPHKTGRHRSKGAIDNATKGKVEMKVISRKRKHEQSREQRRKLLKHIRNNKRVDATFAKKQHTESGAPHLVCILPMHKSIDPNSVIDILTSSQTHPADKVLGRTETGVIYYYYGLLKQKFAFLVPPIGLGNELKVLDYLKVAETTVMLSSANLDEFFDNWGQSIYNMMCAQGIATPTLALMDLLSVNPKRRQSKLETANKFIKQYFPNEKLLTLGTDDETKKMLRMLSERKKLPLQNAKNRPHMFGESVQFEAQGELGTLKVTGYLRGANLDVNSLVHVTDLGDFQMSHIEGYTDPYRLHVNPTLTSTRTFLETADPEKQQSLQAENIPDPMDAEQTWPTEEEIEMSRQENLKAKSVKKLVPKGWSQYQAAWIPDVMDKFVGEEENNDENEGENDNENENEFDIAADDDNDDDEDDEFMSCDGDMSEEQEVTESVTVTDPTARLEERYDNQMDFQEERETLKKIQDSRVDQMYPDEIDTPLDVNARDRFRKYRGLESFRTSPWDPKENLPKDYARIYQFKSFDQTKRRILAESQKSELGIKQGNYIVVHIKDVPTDRWNQYVTAKGGNSLILFGLLPHEHRMSVMNVVLKRNDATNKPIKSKDPLLIQCGYRRFRVNPIYSQHTNGAKHKYERFFQPNTTVCATFYAPIQYPPAPVLAFIEHPNSSLTFVARGSVLSCNPDRIVLKRVVLSGHPMRINRKSATVRYMFFNKEDVNYFKPIKLRTKCGRVGHIKESLGTHGHMKCIFDGQLRSIDCVFMHLYKRIYPKWTYNEGILAAPTSRDKNNHLNDIEEEPMQE